MSLLQKIITFNLLLILLGAVAITTIFYLHSTEVLVSEEKRWMQRDLERQRDNLESRVRSLQLLTRLFALLPGSTALLSPGTTEGTDTTQFPAAIASFMSQNPNLFRVALSDLTGREHLRIEKEKNQIVKTPPHLLQDDNGGTGIMDAIDASPRNIYLSLVYSNGTPGEASTPGLLLIRSAAQVVNPQQQPVGIITIDLDLGTTLDRTSPVIQGRDFRLTLTDDSGNLLYQRGSDQTGASLNDDTGSGSTSVMNTVVIGEGSNKRILNLALYRSNEDIRAANNLLIQEVIAPAIGLTVIFLLLALLVIRAFSRPLNQILSAVKDFPGSGLGSLPVQRRDELGLLSRALVAMKEQRDQTEEELTALNQELESRVAARTRELEHANYLLERTNEVARIGTWSVDIPTMNTEWSQVTVEIHEMEEFGGNANDGIAQYKEGEHRDRIDAAVTAAIERGESYDLELILITAKGNEKWVRAVGYAIVEDGKTVELFGLMQDIDEKVRASEALERAVAEAEAANQAKSDFLARVSHELRTPLNAIMGYGQLLEIDAKLTEEQRTKVKEMLRSSRHLVDLIGEILDLSRIETGQITLLPETIHLGELVSECTTMLGPMLEAADIEVTVELSEDSLLFADRMRLKQVLINLLSNAIKYNKPGGTVEVTAAPSDDFCRISITDTGRGIPPDRLDELFNPFSRLEAADSEVDGVGIGLALSLHLVRLMGGEIGVDSVVDQGSTFWVLLPCSAPQQGL